MEEAALKESTTLDHSEVGKIHAELTASLSEVFFPVTHQREPTKNRNKNAWFNDECRQAKRELLSVVKANDRAKIKAARARYKKGCLSREKGLGKGEVGSP